MGEGVDFHENTTEGVIPRNFDAVFVYLPPGQKAVSGGPRAPDRVNQTPPALGASGSYIVPVSPARWKWVCTEWGVFWW